MSYAQQIERRHVTAELRASDNNGERRIEGYAAVFDTPSDRLPFTEIVERKAFDRSLDDGDDVIALFNHDYNYVLGRRAAETLELATDSTGLHFRVQPPATTWSTDLLASVERGDINGASFGFYVREKGDAWEGDTRYLRDVELVDVSVVSMPAYSATTVAARGAAAAAAEMRAAIDLLRNGNADPDMVRGMIADLLSLLPSENRARAEAGELAGAATAADLQAQIDLMRLRLDRFDTL